MDHSLYQKYRLQYLREAYLDSDKTTASIYRALTEIAPPGRFSPHKEEKIRALRDLREAFEGHRHWPLDIALSHLGVDPKALETDR
jgi:hypothetical protein